MIREFSSRQNPFLRHVRRLGADASYRREEGLYLCDGRHLLEEALRSSMPPADVVAARDVPLPSLPPETRITLVPPALFPSLSPSEHPQGVLSLCRLPRGLPLQPKQGRYLYLERVQDPGNVGSLLRSADAFAFNGVYLSADSADAFHPKTVRAAMGALFRLPVGISDREALLASGIPFWATAPGNNARELGGLSFPKNLILALGNEGQGLLPETLALSARSVRIPMDGGAESLGVAAAGAVLMWEASRRISGGEMEDTPG